MRRYRIQITQELELPDDCTVHSVAGEPVLKIGDVFVSPSVDYLGASTIAVDRASFRELTETDRDRLYAAIAKETTTISELHG